MSANMDFYFDFISPFGYLASLRVDDLAKRHGRACRWHSMLLGISVLKVMGLPPLTQIPLKGDYLGVDLKRYLRRYKLTLARSRETAPSNPIPAGRAFHLIDQRDPAPSNPIPAGRAFHLIDQRDPALAKCVAKAILDAYWQQGAEIGSVDAVIAIAEQAGVDASALRAGFASGEADRLLRAAVDRSLARGVFGSPFFIIDGEPFFGLEKMELVEEWLASGGW
jgi:2-hydroxychromene-2-carboxylate isomerase